MPRSWSRRSLLAAGFLSTCAQLLLVAAAAAVTGGADWPSR